MRLQAIGLLLFIGPCSGKDDASSSGASAPPAATPSVAIPAVPTTLAAATGPCADLAKKCGSCPPGVIQSACNTALTAGAIDPSACTNALNDKDIKAHCGGGGAPAPHATTTAATPAATPAAGHVGPCAELARKCPKCPAGTVLTACNGALTAGAIDPSACTNALNDKDIKSRCN
jgi:hypothetical protein